MSSFESCCIAIDAVDDNYGLLLHLSAGFGGSMRALSTSMSIRYPMSEREHIP
jgi:hypothetical protein